ncbi:MAG: hypothetical protein RL577_1231 [Bacteroidota bacterium]|jgi:hypothetical protein
MRNLAVFILTLFIILRGWAQTTVAPVRVAVLLPFHTEKGSNDAFNQAMLDYWAGIQSAANELADNGINSEINLRNFTADSSFLCSVAGKLWLNQHDLVIGPVYPKQLADLDRGNPITKPWVSPLAPYAFKQASNGISMFANDSLRLLGLCNEFSRCFPKHKIVIISPDKPKNAAQNAANRDRLKALLGDQATVHTWKTQSQTLTPYLPTGNDSFLFVYTDQFTTEAHSFLSKKALDTRNSYGIGAFDWLDAQEKSPLASEQKARMLYPSNVVLHFNDSTVSSISQRMALSEWGEPSKYAFIAYDQFQFLLGHYSANPSMNPFVYGPRNSSAIYQGAIQNICLYPTGYGLGNAGIRLVRLEGEFQIPIVP